MVDREDWEQENWEQENSEQEEDGPLSPFALEVMSRIHQRERRRRARRGLLAVGGTAGGLAIGIALCSGIWSHERSDSRDARARLMAMREIGPDTRPESEAVDDLVILARDQDPVVSMAAGHYLANAVGAASAAARVGQLRGQTGGKETGGKDVGESAAVDELRDAMDFEALLGRLVARPDEELGGAEAGVAMVGIRHPDPNVRGIAWRLVERVVPPGLVSVELDAALDLALFKGASQDRESASTLIVQHHRSGLYPKIAALARSVDPEVRAVSARRLGELRQARWVETLLPLLDDVDANVRLDAAKALAGLGVDRAVEDLVTMAKGDGSVRPWALRALHEMGEPRVRDLANAALEARAPTVLIEACSILGDLRARVDVNRLNALLAAGDVHVRVRAAYVLAANGGEIDPAPLLPFLEVDNPGVRIDAARLLIRLDDDAATRAAERLLSDPMPRVRENVRRLLDE